MCKSQKIMIRTEEILIVFWTSRPPRHPAPILVTQLNHPQNILYILFLIKTKKFLKTIPRRTEEIFLSNNIFLFNV